MTKSFSEISARYRLRSGTVCALRTGARCVQSQPYCLATTRPERRRCQGCGRSPHPKGMALKTPECRAPSRSSRRADRRSCGSSPSRRVTITTSNPVITLRLRGKSADRGSRTDHSITCSTTTPSMQPPRCRQHCARVTSCPGEAFNRRQYPLQEYRASSLSGLRACQPRTTARLDHLCRSRSMRPELGAPLRS